MVTKTIINVELFGGLRRSEQVPMSCGIRKTRRRRSHMVTSGVVWNDVNSQIDLEVCMGVSVVLTASEFHNNVFDKQCNDKSTMLSGTFHSTDMSIYYNV